MGQHAGLGGVACLAAVAAAAPTDPVCGRSWEQVLRWQQGLKNVVDFGEGSQEVLLREEVPKLQRPRVNVLHDHDYQHLRLKFKRPGRLQRNHWARGSKERVMLELRNGWLFPSGFAANATHHFHLGALNEIICVQSHLARLVGREKCIKTDWTRMLVYRNADHVKDAKDTSWLVKGMPTYNFECQALGSLISLIDTQFADYGHFHESILPRLLWPEVQNRRESTVLWRHKPEAEGYIRPWLDLLGLSWRSFQSIRRQNVVFRFDRLYLPLVVGLDRALTDQAEITSHAPQADVVRVRTATIQALASQSPPGVDASRYVVLCERSPTDRRALSGADAVRLRRAAVEFAKAASLKLVCLRGRPGGFETSEVSTRGEVSPWKPMALDAGLRAFMRARMVLGVHGSLLMHIFVAPPGTHVVDIQALHTYDLPLYHYAAVLGFNYWYHPVEGMHSSKTLPLDAPRLEKLLGKVLAQLKEGGQPGMTSGEL